MKLEKSRKQPARKTNQRKRAEFAEVQENEAVMLADKVKNYDSTELISFLREQNSLVLADEDDLEKIRKQKIVGCDFLKMTYDMFERCGLEIGPALRLASFTKEIKEKKLRSFSSYKTKKDLKDVLAKHGVNGNGAGAIPQFSPKTYPLEDEDEELLQCVQEIKRRLGNMGGILFDSNEAMRREYISIILHASLYIVKRITQKKLTLEPRSEIIGEEDTVYAIKALEELLCITEGKLNNIHIGLAQNLVQCKSALQVNKKRRKASDAFREDYDYVYGIVTTATDWYFILYSSDGISCTSKDPLHICFLESALKEGSKEEKELHNNVKQVMEVIVGLLKDRVDVEKEPSKKKQRVQEYFEKE